MSFQSITGASPVFLGIAAVAGSFRDPRILLVGDLPCHLHQQLCFLPSLAFRNSPHSPVCLSPSHRWLASAPQQSWKHSNHSEPQNNPPLLSSSLGMASCLSFLNMPTVLHASPILSCCAELKSPGNRSREVSLVPTDHCEGIKAARLGPMCRLGQAPRSSG